MLQIELHLENLYPSPRKLARSFYSLVSARRKIMDVNTIMTFQA